MPKIFVTHRPYHKVNDVQLEGLCEKLRTLVAEVLTCSDPQGQLEAGDVEVEIQPWHLGHIGSEQYDLKITVIARELPSRKANLDERAQELAKKFKAICPSDVRGYIWVLLPPASFVPF